MNTIYNLYTMVRQHIARAGRHLPGVAMVALLMGCSAESTLLPGGPDPYVPSETGYLSLTVDTGDDITTRASNEKPEGRPTERNVQAVRLVLYDGNSDAARVVRSIDYDIQTTSGGTGWTGTGLAPGQTSKTKFVTVAQRVPYMDYYALAIVNPTADMLAATQEQSTLGNFREAKMVEAGTKTSNIGGLATANSFPMTNNKELLAINKDTHLQRTINSAHVNPVTVCVERMVVKVSLTLPSGKVIIPCVNGASVEDLTWGLDITNRWTYWLRRKTEAYNTPIKNWYATDPNYTNTSQSTQAVREGQFFYYHTQGNTPGALPNSLNDIEYCLENTMDLNEQRYNNIATRVLIRATYRPAGIDAAGDSFYAITLPDGKVFTYSTRDIKQLVEVSRLQQLTNTVSDAGKIVLDETANGYDFATGGAPTLNGTPITASFDTGKIKYYYKGVCYYAIKILHSGSQHEETPTTEGHYGVLRNSFYDVELTKVEGPGAINLDAADIATRASEVTDDALYHNIQASIRRTTEAYN